MIDTCYNVMLYPVEGPTNIQVQVNDQDGSVRLEVYTEQDSGKTVKSVFTFTSDNDLKTIIDTMKWARVKSLQVQGFKVVT
jgi:hypothetical protein